MFPVCFMCLARKQYQKYSQSSLQQLLLHPLIFRTTLVLIISYSLFLFCPYHYILLLMNRLSSLLPKKTTNIKTSTSSTTINHRPRHSLSQLSSIFSFFSLKSTSSPETDMTAMNSNNSSSSIHRRQKLKKLVVVMGATGSGKSKLSVDLGTRFFPNSEIVNSDKIQVYRGLDIATNKISMHDRKGVPHHFLGEFDPETEFTPSDFRELAPKTIAQITSRRNLPLIVGGSNSFIYSLLAKRFNSETDVFDESSAINSVSSELRYSCCFLWVDVSLPILNEYLDKRVDEMLDSGMYEELEEYFAREGFAESESASRTGLRKAIGVPEFERYFKRVGLGGGADGSEAEKRLSYEEAVKAIKENTCTLAKRQQEKIQRLKDAGWDLQKIDATEAFRAAMGMTSDSGKRASDIWEKMVVEPSAKIVKRFLME
ncbi:adenylate isopentenyltransferase [Coffea arabica]|uniref:Adenylate isopentenyltransferase n=2 Tax=Coffea TaxID=13442 RepID=A0ABM4W7M3_COFAR